MHAGLGFKIGESYFSLRREKLDHLRNELDEHLAVLICDEMSMIGASYLYGIHQRLVEIMICDDFFGGMATLYVVSKNLNYQGQFNFSKFSKQTNFGHTLVTSELILNA